MWLQSAKRDANSRSEAIPSGLPRTEHLGDWKRFIATSRRDVCFLHSICPPGGQLKVFVFGKWKSGTSTYEWINYFFLIWKNYMRMFFYICMFLSQPCQRFVAMFGQSWEATLHLAGPGVANPTKRGKTKFGPPHTSHRGISNKQIKDIHYIILRYVTLRYVTLYYMPVH